MISIAIAGCDTAPAPAPVSAAKSPTVASLSPAATDLIVSMGAAEHLVAVSTYDADRAGTVGLPRAGDYQNTDWEQLRQLRPQIMIRQFSPDRAPPGLLERAGELHIKLLNPQIHTIEDIYLATRQIGEAINEPDLAAVLEAQIRKRLRAVADRTASRPRVRTLIVIDELAQNVIGPGAFIDEILTLAGGSNAAESLGQPYPSIDREQLRALDPAAIIQLLPNAPEQALAQAAQTWKSLESLPAVSRHRVDTFTDWYLLLPGAHVAEVAEKFADALHPLTDAGKE